jgi:hypothetical protein
MRDQQREQQKAQMDAQIKAMEAEMQRQAEEQKLQFAQWKAELDAAVKIEVANVSATATQNAATQAAEREIVSEVKQDPMAPLIQGLTEVLAQSQRPKRIVRGPDGRAEGIE